jgi:hypothetical protein
VTVWAHKSHIADPGLAFTCANGNEMVHLKDVSDDRTKLLARYEAATLACGRMGACVQQPPQHWIPSMLKNLPHRTAALEKDESARRWARAHADLLERRTPSGMTPPSCLNSACFFGHQRDTGLLEQFVKLRAAPWPKDVCEPECRGFVPSDARVPCDLDVVSVRLEVD